MHEKECFDSIRYEDGICICMKPAGHEGEHECDCGEEWE